jgi:hypothetical protein
MLLLHREDIRFYKFAVLNPAVTVPWETPLALFAF